MRRLSMRNRLQKTAELELEHDVEARREAKRTGVEVGKRVRYDYNGEHWGTVKSTHHKMVVVQLTAAGLVKGGENMIVREDEVPWNAIKEVLGDGQLAVRQMPVGSGKPAFPPPPPREGGYSCHQRGCEGSVVKVYSVRKMNREIGQLDVPTLVAFCKNHDEPYIGASQPNKGGIMEQSATIPALWNLGVVFDEFMMPPEKKVADPISNPTEEAPEIGFEFCWCGRKYGHSGTHRKPEDQE